VLGIVITTTTPTSVGAVEPEQFSPVESQTLSLIGKNVAPIEVTRDGFEIEVAEVPSYSYARVSSGAAISYAGGGILGAARAQLGVYQDCTALVENSLRMLGYSVGDLGTMSFGGYGVQVSPAEAQPGDIMMRGSHVAIYSGNGVAIHGGYNGTTIETGGNISNPHNYAVIIRVQ
jgi:hypothetical protein